MVSFQDFLHLYKEEFLPAYSDLVGYIGDKPAGMLLDIENTFSHLMVHHFIEDSQLKQENLEKSYNHLVRLTLDCHKLLWTTINKIIDNLIGDEEKRKFIVNLPEDELIKKYKEYKSSAQYARKTEIENVGINPLLAIAEYKKATRLGLEILDSIDEIKDKHYKKFKIWYQIKTQGLGLLIGGILGGLIVLIIWECILKL